MILQSLIQMISTALAFLLLSTLVSSLVFYARYKMGSTLVHPVKETVTSLPASEQQIELAERAFTATSRKNYQFENTFEPTKEEQITG